MRLVGGCGQRFISPSYSARKTRRIKLKIHIHKEKRNKNENQPVSELDFRRIGDKLVGGTDFRLYRSPVLSSLYRLFQQKYVKTSQVYNCSFAPRSEIPAQTHCVFVSCWAFLCRSRSRFLAGPSRTRTGKRPAFLFFGCHVANRTSTSSF